MTNVKASPPQENISIDDDVFVLIEKSILKGVFGFGCSGFVVICYYTFSNKIVFSKVLSVRQAFSSRK